MPTVNSIMDKIIVNSSKKSFKTLRLQAQREAKASNPRELPEPKEPEANWRLASKQLTKKEQDDA